MDGSITKTPTKQKRRTRWFLPKFPLKQATDDDGKAITGEHAYDYKFKFVLKNGEKRTLDYELSGEKVKPFTPNAVIKAEISKKRAIKGPNEISKDKVPNKVRKILNID